MRSKYKKKFVSRELFIKLKNIKGRVTRLNLFGRSSTLIQRLAGAKLLHYNGRKNQVVRLAEGHIGLKVGELFFTRKLAKHSGKMDAYALGLLKRRKKKK